MQADEKRLLELRQEGLCCASMLVQLGLELKGDRNPQMVQAAGALCNGLWNGGACGAETGAVCTLGLFDRRELSEMSREFSEWFEETYTEAYGSCRCRDILGDNPFSHKMERCPQIIMASWQKAREILRAHDVDIDDMIEDLEDRS